MGLLYHPVRLGPVHYRLEHLEIDAQRGPAFLLARPESSAAVQPVHRDGRERDVLSREFLHRRQQRMVAAVRARLPVEPQLLYSCLYRGVHRGGGATPQPDIQEVESEVATLGERFHLPLDDGEAVLYARTCLCEPAALAFRKVHPVFP